MGYLDLALISKSLRLTPQVSRYHYGQKWQYIIVYSMPLLSRGGVGELLVILGYSVSCDTIPSLVKIKLEGSPCT